ncbi:MAG: hypothetical protein ACE5EF_11050 [Dehalococcoidia bacterium]
MNEQPVCRACGDDITPDFEAWCNSCGEAYHLNQRAGDESRDCGKVWINEEHMALEFACNVCLSGESSELNDVLDLTEAAEAAGVSPDRLSAAAAAGRVPHRKTAGGVLLFVRRDLARLESSNE